MDFWRGVLTKTYRPTCLVMPAALANERKKAND
jgi:hypothetical protein